MSMIGTPPVNEPIQGLMTKAWAEWCTSVFYICFDQQASGTTAQRPTKCLYVGKYYFDTTIGKPIWLKTVATNSWVKADGTAA